MAWVVDASIFLSWYFEDESDVSDTLIWSLAETDIVVPAHWAAEVGNGIIIGERRNRSKPSQVAGLQALLDIFRIEIDAEGNADALGRILPLARAHRLTVYDTIYLELAERRGLALATLDGPLARAARSVGITVLGAGRQNV